MWRIFLSKTSDEPQLYYICHAKLFSAWSMLLPRVNIYRLSLRASRTGVTVITKSYITIIYHSYTMKRVIVCLHRGEKRINYTCREKVWPVCTRETASSSLTAYFFLPIALICQWQKLHSSLSVVNSSYSYVCTTLFFCQINMSQYVWLISSALNCN